MCSTSGLLSWGEIFAVPAAIAVQNAQVLAQAQRLAAQLQSALETGGVIDRAVGILRSRSGGTENEALVRLRTLSQNEHRKLTVVARQIIDEAVRRAKARHHSDRPDLHIPGFELGAAVKAAYS